ncbi:DMP19 family protein [Candidatus Stoquefichus sp. SB1]|uniref:DMP19 family protein n=1 Tax=Candidatus Stoquefichus sp. SB1 TaxID=1658109 RepID=UPI00067E8532|nr:DMP19 family protein [Candidatus Stoquefichus sp. SB1]
MATYEDVLDNVTLQASKIIARQNTENIVTDLYNIICQKCENGDLINELNGIERVFYLCQTFELNMNNGGIHQYYENSAGNFANETVEALVEIKAMNTALILDKANSIFKEGIVPEDCDARIEELESLDYSEVSWFLDELDHQFYECVDDLSSLNLKYVLTNKEAFM